ncbi:HAD hydrolase, family IA, variant 3 [Clostridiales bacterium KA00134]|nr:HAD hydrolase, family IA, variant 3 [Clostridiales bacterium KA00134]
MLECFSKGGNMEGYLFDLDGTLLDSMSMWRSLTLNFLKSHNLTFTEELAQELTTMSIKTSADYLRDLYKLDLTSKEIIEEMEKNIVKGYKNEVPLKEGALEVLKALKNQGKKLAIATATNDKYVKIVMDKFKLGDYFDFIATVDNMGILKNDPQFYLKASQKFDLSPKEVTLFDDAPFAIEAALKAGLRVVCMYDKSADAYFEKQKEACDMALKSFKEYLK